MKTRVLEDRLIRIIGFAVMVGLALALLFAFREGLLPSQEDGDVFGTVYVIQPEKTAEVSSGLS